MKLQKVLLGYQVTYLPAGSLFGRNTLITFMAEMFLEIESDTYREH
ncbi:hypothetical protein [Mariniflexile sp.]